MSLFATIRRKRYSALKLSVVAVAWLTVFASPCSMALLSDGQPQEAMGTSEIHQHSLEQPANPTIGGDCCCDHLDALKCDHPDALKAESTKPYKSMPIIGLPMDQQVFAPALLADLQKFRYKAPVQLNSPPLYLGTQRIRL